MIFTTRAILDQHIRECREDRARTSDQFKYIVERVERLDAKTDKRHDENRAQLDKILRYIWLAMGMFAMMSFLISHDGLGKIINALVGG